MKRLVVVDGKSVFYRGYYAMGGLKTREGIPTGGVFGFAAIAMEIVRKMAPDKVVVAWDKAGTSIAKRKAIYSEYKAGRVKPPEDFFAQIPLLRELIDGLGWGFVEIDEYEADDIIGTLAAQVSLSAQISASSSSADNDRALENGDFRDFSRSEEWEMYIISSDLDMLQVVSPNVKMYRLLKGFSEIEEMDIRAIEEKYGIEKAQFLDLKALKGDTSDNIPGVPGIGEKTAVRLLNEYQTLEGIYKNIESIKGATQKKLLEGKESAEMSKKLATIMTDAPVKIEDVPDFVVDKEKMRAALEKLEFSSLVRKFGLGEKSGSRGDSLDVSSGRAVSDVSSREATKGLSEEVLDESGEGVEISGEFLVEWDVKGRMHRDEEFAKEVLGGREVWDLGQGKFLLEPLGKKDEQVSLLQDKEEEFNRQKREFAKQPKLYKVFSEFDMPMIPVLYKMEKEGIKISREYFVRLREEFREKVGKLEEEIFQLAGERFNANSPVQLGEVLFSRLGLPTRGIKKTTRGYSTGAKELEKLKGEHPVIGKLIEYREAAKLLSTYILPLMEVADENDRIHTTFTQDVTATGRLSSLNPNLQNIPVRSEDGKRIREGFVAEEGKVFVSADYSQFELRLAAVLAGDMELIKDFQSGTDIHTKTASEAFGVPFEQVTKSQRRAAKVINFGVLYGMSAKGLADAAEMSVGEAKVFIDKYFQVRKPIKDYLEKILKQAREEGYVETYFGRKKPTPDVKSPNFLVRSGAERAAQNMPIQGTEADLVKRAMILIDRELPEGAKMIMQVHDSIMVECSTEQAEEVVGILKWVMESVAPELKIRLDVDIEVGERWG